MYPIGYINREYTAPWHPLPAIIVGVLTVATLIGMYFGYWINMLSGFVFYLIASIWFVAHRYNKVDQMKFIEAGCKTWPRPKGY